MDSGSQARRVGQSRRRRLAARPPGSWSAGTPAPTPAATRNGRDLEHPAAWALGCAGHRRRRHPQQPGPGAAGSRRAERSPRAAGGARPAPASRQLAVGGLRLASRSRTCYPSALAPSLVVLPSRARAPPAGRVRALGLPGQARWLDAAGDGLMSVTPWSHRCNARDPAPVAEALRQENRAAAANRGFGEQGLAAAELLAHRHLLGIAVQGGVAARPLAAGQSPCDRVWICGSRRAGCRRRLASERNSINTWVLITTSWSAMSSSSQRRTCSDLAASR